MNKKLIKVVAVTSAMSILLVFFSVFLIGSYWTLCTLINQKQNERK